MMGFPIASWGGFLAKKMVSSSKPKLEWEAIGLFALSGETMVQPSLEFLVTSGSSIVII